MIWAPRNTKKSAKTTMLRLLSRHMRPMGESPCCGVEPPAGHSPSRRHAPAAVIALGGGPLSPRGHKDGWLHPCTQMSTSHADCADAARRARLQISQPPGDPIASDAAAPALGGEATGDQTSSDP